MTPSDDPNPTDESVESSIRKERRYLDRKENSIVPEFLENDGLPPGEEISRDEARRSSRQKLEEDTETFNELSSDKEDDSTEGEITDTNTAE